MPNPEYLYFFKKKKMLFYVYASRKCGMRVMQREFVKIVREIIGDFGHNTHSIYPKLASQDLQVLCRIDFTDLITLLLIRGYLSEDIKEECKLLSKSEE